jgi:hypothetical protein
VTTKIKPLRSASRSFFGAAAALGDAFARSASNAVAGRFWPKSLTGGFNYS